MYKCDYQAAIFGALCLALQKPSEYPISYCWLLSFSLGYSSIFSAWGLLLGRCTCLCHGVTWQIVCRRGSRTGAHAYGLVFASRWGFPAGSCISTCWLLLWRHFFGQRIFCLLPFPRPFLAFGIGQGSWSYWKPGG